MEKKKTRARLENRRRKWVTRNMFSTSSWIPIMILKRRNFLGKIFGEVQQLADRLVTGGGFCTIPVAAPETRPRLYTLVCFAKNKSWDFYFFSNKM